MAMVVLRTEGGTMTDTVTDISAIPLMIDTVMITMAMVVLLTEGGTMTDTVVDISAIPLMIDTVMIIMATIIMADHIVEGTTTATPAWTTVDITQGGISAWKIGLTTATLRMATTTWVTTATHLMSTTTIDVTARVLIAMTLIAVELVDTCSMMVQWSNKNF